MGFANNVVPGWMIQEMNNREVALLMGAQVKDDKFYQAAFEIGQARSWDDWHSPFYGSRSGPMTIPGMGTVERVAVQEDPRDQDSYGWGEFPQGSEGELHVTWRVTFEDGKVRYFRKYGTADSYGRNEWMGDFREVRPVEKPTTVYVEV